MSKDPRVRKTVIPPMYDSGPTLPPVYDPKTGMSKVGSAPAFASTDKTEAFRRLLHGVPEVAAEAATTQPVESKKVKASLDGIDSHFQACSPWAVLHAVVVYFLTRAPADIFEILRKKRIDARKKLPFAKATLEIDPVEDEFLSTLRKLKGILDLHPELTAALHESLGSVASPTRAEQEPVWGTDNLIDFALPTEAAREVGVSNVAVFKAISTGRLRTYKLGGKRDVVSLKDCRAIWQKPT